MNLFAPQSYQAQIELEEIGEIKYQLISPASSRTIIGVVQDGLIGAYNLTQDNMSVDWKTAMNLIAYTSFTQLEKFEKNRSYSGHELYSMILPDKLNIRKGKVIIENGVMKSGALDKSYLGPGGGNNITQIILDQYGVEEAKTFLDDTQRLINNFNLYNGFTAGIGDVDIKPELEKQLLSIFDTKRLEVEHLITEMENNPDMMDNELLETTIFSVLNNIRDDVSSIISKNLKKTNNFLIMQVSGSKGTIVNIGQMGGCIGQQAVEGKRIAKRLHNRTLPYFFQNEDSAPARGLIERSYTKGQLWPEFIFHNMASREGLIDGAIKTAESGYVQRKLIKSMEDAMVKYDGTIRTATNVIIQFVYGDSGLDTVKQHEYKFNMIELDDTTLLKKYKFDSSEKGSYDKKFDNEEYAKYMLKIRDNLRDTMIRSQLKYVSIKSNAFIAVNLNRILDNCKAHKAKNSDKLDASYILEQIDYILEPTNTRISCMTKKNSTDPKSLKYKDDQTAKTMLRMALHDCFAPRRSILEHKLNKEQFDYAVEEIIRTFKKAIAEPGEMEGIIAAQSIGEPVTQMTLNAFHSSGIAAMANTNSGVPRIKELLSFSKNIKTPKMFVYLTEDQMGNRELANRIASHIKYTTIGQLRKRIDIYYDVDPYAKDGLMVKDNVRNIFYGLSQAKSTCQTDITNLPWLMRIEFDREKMLNKEVTLLDIKSKFCNTWEKRYADIKSIKKEEKNLLDKITNCAVLSNTDNDKMPIMHIRFDMNDYNTATLVEFMELFVDKFRIKGIPNIEDNYVSEEKMINYNNPEHSIEKKTNYLLYTDGINLTDIRYINNIDLNRTFCNDIISIYENFGIEATRAVLLKELTTTFENGGAQVNAQHMALLVDIMTNNGDVTSIDRHGMNRIDNDPLSRASFEKTVDQLLAAAVFNKVDSMQSVSSRIMSGLAFRGGTGYCNLILDTHAIEQSEYVEDVGGDEYRKNYSLLTTNSLVEDIVNKDNEGIFMPS